MRPFFLALLTAATAVYAQQPLTEKIDVSVVNVDVTVTANGKPIRGLTRDDFEIFEDGRRQTITNVYVAEKNVEPPPATTATPPCPLPRWRTPPHNPNRLASSSPPLVRCLPS